MGDIIRAVLAETAGRTAEGVGQAADTAGQLYNIPAYARQGMDMLAGTQSPPEWTTPQFQPQAAASVRQRVGIPPAEQMPTMAQRTSGLLWNAVGPSFLPGIGRALLDRPVGLAVKPEKPGLRAIPRTQAEAREAATNIALRKARIAQDNISQRAHELMPLQQRAQTLEARLAEMDKTHQEGLLQRLEALAKQESGVEAPTEPTTPKAPVVEKLPYMGPSERRATTSTKAPVEEAESAAAPVPAVRDEVSKAVTTYVRPPKDRGLSPREYSQGVDAMRVHLLETYGEDAMLKFNEGLGQHEDHPAFQRILYAAEAAIPAKGK